MAVRRDALTAASAEGLDVATIRRLALWTLLATKLTGAWGLGWDIRWHVLIGRDSFWIPPHVLTYASVGIAALVAFGALRLETRAATRGRPRSDTIRMVGLTGARGLHVAAWGMALTILAAPIDDLWHRLFGLDVTLWSPPHLLGLAGAQINTLGCLLLAREVPGLGARERIAALLAGGTALLGTFEVTVDPAVRTAFLAGGVLVFWWAILGAAAFGFALALVTSLTGRRWAPLAIAAGAVVVQVSVVAVSDVGFALVQPESQIEAAIAGAPDSPIAVAHEIARRNGTRPGRSYALRLLPVAAAIVLVAADVRRRPGLASALFGASLAIASGTLFTRMPALAHVRPDPLTVALGVSGAAVAAVLGALLAVRVAR